MNKCAILGVIILLLVFNFGCKDDPNDDGRNVTIEDEFKILPWESLEPDSRKFHLNIETIQSQSCENALIDLTPNAVGSKITLTILDIPEPDCPAPIFPAHADFEVGNLNLTEYSLQISLKNLVHNIGNLMVTDEYYDIQMTDSDGIIIPNQRLYKIPTETIWGYASYATTDAEVAVDNFIAEVENISNGYDYEDGYYGYFSVENNSLAIHDEDIAMDYNQSFGFAFQDNLIELQTILSEYRSLYPNIDFKIFTSKGEVL